jgi:hypothetical protein
MKLSFALLLAATSTAAAFVPHQSAAFTRSSIVTKGYLDDMSKYTQDPEAVPEEDDSREATNYSKEKLDRAGPSDWSQFVDFDEFDGGDGQMGVAGDGEKGLSKEWKGEAEMFKSKTMSAKNAWGKSTGYADELKEQGMEETRAQQMENWRNQREVQEQRNQHRWMTDEFDNNKSEEDWRGLSSYGGEQVSDSNLDQELGAVVPGPITSTIDMQSRVNRVEVFEFPLKNPFMGFSDFRARFTGMSNAAEWSVEPTDGSLNGRGDPTQFLVKYRPQNPGASEGFLVIETEEDKWTYKLNGFASM